jgi:hypothetical protein
LNFKAIGKVIVQDNKKVFSAEFDNLREGMKNNDFKNNLLRKLFSSLRGGL